MVEIPRFPAFALRQALANLAADRASAADQERWHPGDLAARYEDRARDHRQQHLERVLDTV
jgi:hypothetical protein